MSWISRRPLLACALLAFGVRGGLALLTERAPIFPPHYYSDARIVDIAAWSVAQARAEGRPYALPTSPSRRIQVFLLSRMYSAIGHHPLAPKLLAALTAAVSVAVLGRIASLAVAPAAGTALALFTALWPSNAFFGSQNFKDAYVWLFVYLTWWAALILARPDESPTPRRMAAAAATLWTCLIVVGFLRGYLMFVLTAALVAYAALALARSLRQARPWAAPALGLTMGLAGHLSFRPIAWLVMDKALRAPQGQTGDMITEWDLIPTTYDHGQKAFVRPFSPEGVTRTRKLRQMADREWARKVQQRAIGTQLFPEQEFHGWGDILRFLPKGLTYALLMPLPGLYPLEGNLGRVLASLENIVLIAMLGLGAAGFARGPRRLESWAFAAFFWLVAAGSALLEFDLGSAARHKALYLPFAFPFAWLLLDRRRPPKRKRLRVLQVLECGGPGGTGNQVAALCNGLDPARFEAVLVFASRGSDPEAYRRLASGAARAHHVPELVREISPWSDWRALRRLIALFREELPDVVHAHSSKAGILARLAALWTGVPRVYYSPHGYGFLQRDRSALSRGLYRAAEWSVSWIGEIVAVSAGEAELARPLAWGKPVHTVVDPYLGRPPDRPSPPRNGLVVGACGRLTAARDPEAYLRLAAAVFKARPEAAAVWIGGGDGEPEFRRAVEKAGLRGRLEVTGWLDADAVRERLAGLAVFVHYSRWDALPNAVLEAMAAGLPVVASDIPGNRDAVVHGETGFLAKDEGELLSRSLELLSDPGLRRRLGGAGRERVRREFSRDAALAALAGLYSTPPPTAN